MTKGKNIAYVRVSTTDQNEARQNEALNKYNIDKWYVEKITGKDTNRPISHCFLVLVSFHKGWL